MLHVFDHGGAAPLRRLIRSAIVARLESLKKENGLYLSQIIELPAEVGSSDGSIEFMLSDYVQGRFPTVAIALGDRNYRARSTDLLSLDGTMMVQVYVIARHQRSTFSRMVGDMVGDESLTADPGVETISEHVIELLTGQTLGVAGSGAMTIESEQVIQFDEEHLIWQLNFAIPTTNKINPNRSAAVFASSVELHHRVVSPTDTPRVTDPGPVVSQLIEDES